MGHIGLCDVKLSQLKQISVVNGDVLHILKSSDRDFNGFGEAYFSFIQEGRIKAWKMHKEMTLNIVVPIGEIRFVLTDLQNGFREFTIGSNNYARLTIPPGIWFGFQGLGIGNNLLLNLANIVHNPEESLRKEISEINFNWKNK